MIFRRKKIINRKENYILIRRLCLERKEFRRNKMVHRKENCELIKILCIERKVFRRKKMVHRKENCELIKILCIERKVFRRKKMHVFPRVTVPGMLRWVSSPARARLCKLHNQGLHNTFRDFTLYTTSSVDLILFLSSV